MRLAVPLVVAVALVDAAGAASAPAVRLACTLDAPAQRVAGEPVSIAFALRNGGARAVDVLVWGTPFEPAWFAPYVEVHRDDTRLVYGGAMVKRGDPTRNQYVHIEPGETRRATIDLAAVFEVHIPGRYRVEPRITLHDVVSDGDASVPRPRGQHVAVSLHCAPLTFQIVARR